MTYLQGMDAQVMLFCKSVGFGFLLGIVYDLGHGIRKLLVRKKGVILWDVAFGLLAAVASFMFDLTQNGGSLRLYMLLGEVSGFLVWYFLAGVPIRNFMDWLWKKMEKGRAKISKPVEKIENKMQSFMNMAENNLKKVLKKSEFLLKLYRGMVYNHLK